MRYRLYREHKYLLLQFSAVLQQCGVTNFASDESVLSVQKSIEQLFMLLESHADYEETRIHKMLRAHGSLLAADKADLDHAQHKVAELKIQNIFNEIVRDKNDSKRQEMGYQLYLELRDFLTSTLEHLNYEERVIMPELQRLFTDDELREIDYISYRQMLPEQMVHMMEELSSVMSLQDKIIYFEDMNTCEPEKFAIAWQKLRQLVTASQAEEIENLITIQSPARPLDPVKLQYPWEDMEEDASSQLDYHKK